MSLTWKKCLLSLCCLFMCATISQTTLGMVIFVDDRLITDPQEKAALSNAIDSLKKNPSDLPSLEILLKTLPDAVPYTTNTYILKAKEQLKMDACALIRGYYSADMLKQTLEKGSDLAAQWACLKIILQSWNADNKQIQEIGGVIDAKAKATLKTPVLEAIKRNDPAARSAAVHAFSVVASKEELTKLAKEVLADKSEAVKAAGIEQLALNEYSDADVEKVIEQSLMESKDPTLLIACCHWWASGRIKREKPMSADLEMRFLDLLTHKDPLVQHGALSAVSTHATAKHPALVFALVDIVEGTGDDSARSGAVRMLNKTHTQYIHDKLVIWSQSDKSEAVRMEAQRMLDGYNWLPEFMKE